VDAAHGAFGAVSRVDDPGTTGLRQERANGEGAPVTILDFVGAQHLERVFMVAMDYRTNGMQWHLRLHSCIS
jgi:hypothetical protein